MSYAVAGALVLRLPPIRPPVVEFGEKTGYREVVRDRVYIGLAVLNVVVALHDSLLLVAMPLWILTRTSAPLALTGLLFTLNTVLVVLLQVRATRSITAQAGISRSYRTAAISFTVACAGFALAAGAPPVAAIALLVIALAALTVGELENTAGEWFLSVELAPTRMRGRYLSVFKTSMALQQAIGPLIVTAALVHLGRMGWLALALVLAGGALASRRLGTRAMQERACLPFDIDSPVSSRVGVADMCELLSVEHEVDRGDPPVGDREADHGERSAGLADDGTCGAVDDGRPSERRQTRAGQ